MSREGRKALVFFAGMSLVVTAATFLFVRTLTRAAGPDAGIFGALKQTEGDALKLEVSGAAQPLRVHRHFFERITVEADLEARQGVAAATLDLEGALGRTKVSSLGLERIPFVHDGSDWEPEAGWAPRLTRILSTLERRRQALEAGDAAALAELARTTKEAVQADPRLAPVLLMRDRRYQVSGWYIRSERGSAEVREEYRFEAATPDRPVDEKGARLLRLTEVGGEFFFAAGLM